MKPMRTLVLLSVFAWSATTFAAESTATPTKPPAKAPPKVEAQPAPPATQTPLQREAARYATLTDYLQQTLDAYGRGDDDARFLGALTVAAQQGSAPLYVLEAAAAIDNNLLSKPSLGIEQLKTLYANPALSADAKHVVSQLLAKALYATGNGEEAYAIQEAQGIVADWMLMGPFGKHGDGDFYDTFPPEQEIDLDAKLTALGRPATWQQFPRRETIPTIINPWLWTHPKRGMLYLFSQCKLEKPTEMILEVTTPYAFTVWVSGQQVATIDRFSQEYPSRVRIPLKVGAGWQQILIKLAHDFGATDFQLRLLNTSGAPLEGLTYETGRTLHPLDDSAPVEILAQPKEAPVAAGTLSKLALFARALHAHNLGQPDLAMRWLTLMDQTAKPTPANKALGKQQAAALAAWTAEIYKNATPYPPATRMSMAQNLYDNAVTLDPACVPAAVALGKAAANRSHFAKAAAYFQQAVKANPKSIFARYEQGVTANAFDWPDTPDEALQALQSMAPNSPSTHTLAAKIYESRGQTAKEANAQIAATKHLPLGSIGRTIAIDQLARAGESEKACALLEEALAARPHCLVLLDMYGSALLRAGQWKKAEEVFKSKVTLNPREDWSYKNLGDALFAQDKIEKAVQAYETCLALNPGQADLRRLIYRLTDKDFAFWKPYVIDPKKALRDFNKSSRPYGKTARVIDHTIIEVHPDGSYTNYTHEMMKILNPGGIKVASEIYVRPGSEILLARTLPKRGGAVVPIYLPDQYVLTMPALAVGASTEFKYLYDEETPFDLTARIPKWYFRSPSKEESFILSQYIIKVPHGVPFIYEARNLNGDVEYEVEKTPEATIHIWTARNMPRAMHEDGTPNIDERLPFVDAATKRDWKDINQLYLSSLTGNLQQTTAIQETVTALIKGLPQPLALDPVARDRLIADTIHTYVCRSIDESSSNDPASYVLAQRYGRREFLLLTLLRAAGISAWYAPTRSPETIEHQPNWNVPKMEQFLIPMVVAEIGGEKVWYDTRYRYIAPGVILDDVAGGTALRIDREGGRFLTVPPRTPEAFATHTKLTINLGAQASEQDQQASNAALRGALSVGGGKGELWKEQYADASPVQQLARLEAELSTYLPGLSLQVEAFEPASSGPFVVAFTAEVPMMTTFRKGGIRATRLALAPLDMLPKDDQALEDRDTPYHLAAYHVGQDVVRYVLPAGAQMVKLPEPLRLRTPFGFYECSTQIEGDAVVLTRRYGFPPQRVTLDDWDAYIEMMRTIERTEQQFLLWQAEAVTDATQTKEEGSQAEAGK